MTSPPRPLPRTRPEAVGVDPHAVQRMIKAFDARGETHSVMLLRHGQVVTEQWWHPHAPADPHLLFSVSKTFVSAAVGLAVAEGRLALDDRVVDLLPDDAPDAPSENLQAMRVRDLLTMTTGHAVDPSTVDEPSGPYANDWPKAFLRAPVEHRPGTRFVYNSAASYLLSAILQRLTGERVLDYLTPRVLAPLGFTGATWQQCPRGIDCGGWGLAITTEDMARFGQLLLQGGRWGDRQLLPAGWTDQMMTVHADNSVQGWGKEASVGYGFQMWRCTNGAWRGDGAFGQFIVVWPEHDVVLAVTGESEDLDTQLRSVWTALDGAFDQAATVAATDLAPPAAQRLQVPVPDGEAWAPVGDLVEGRTFVIETDASPAAGATGFPATLEAPETVVVRRDGDFLAYEAGALRGAATLGSWHVGPGSAAVSAGREEYPLAAAYAWTGEQTLELRVAAAGTPFVWTLVLVFSADGRTAEVSLDQNVAFTQTNLLRGTARSDDAA